MVSTTKLLIAYAAMAGIVAAQRRYAAVPTATSGLSPRYLLDRAIPLLKRQDVCAEGQHPCEDVGYGGQCCNNDEYCYINDDLDLQCCAIGSSCRSDNSICTEDDQYRCTSTITQSESGTATTSVATGCCFRQCTATSQYRCPESMGGMCCAYGSECATSACVFQANPSSSLTLTPIPEGCTTSQFACTDGLGCCDNGQVCTEVSGTGYCAASNPTNTDVTIEDNPSSDELSDGATAGIAVGAVVGSGLIIAALTWLCLSRRRRRREQTATQRSGTSAPRHIGEDGMTDVTAPSSRAPRNRAGTVDYFGPDPVVGPYTETEFSSPAASPGFGRAVPTQPETPGDITAAVEIDSQASPGRERSPSNASVYATPVSETIDTRFELYEAPAEIYGTEYRPRRSDSVRRGP